MALKAAEGIPGRVLPAQGIGPVPRPYPKELNQQAQARQTSPVEVIDAAGRAPLIDEAAQIWTEATAARDGHDQMPPPEAARAVIQGVLDRSSRAFLLIARSADGTTAAFAAIEPAPGSNGTVAQVTYLGVRPRRWGQGIGEILLRRARQRLKTAGYTNAELSVYVDNQRATALYERLGWQAIGPPTPHPKTGKPEQRYELHL